MINHVILSITMSKLPTKSPSSFVLCVCIVLWFLLNVYYVLKSATPVKSPERYLINTSSCTVPALEPFNEDVVPFYTKEDHTECSTLHLLSYIDYSSDYQKIFLRINGTLNADYSLTSVTCCFEYLFNNTTTTCQPIDNKVEVSDKSLLRVNCFNYFGQKVYTNVHATFSSRGGSVGGVHPYNVLLIGVDTMSRLNLQRTMPSTFNSLSKSDNWVELRAYNKIEDNTFPNLMALLTGRNLSDVMTSCQPTIKFLDNCNLIWQDFAKANYTTAYAEDEYTLNTFNYLLKGFEAPPTEYYFRPYFQWAEQLSITHKYLMKYCTGPEVTANRVLNLVKDFLQNSGPKPKFGLFWMNSFSHNNMNTAGGMDHTFKNFFQRLEPLLNNTILVFFSDHGFRFGKYVYTYSGWLEQRLPFFFIRLPEQFIRDQEVKFRNLQENSRQLTSPYDVYLTLQEVLGAEPQVSRACPGCRSLFTRGVPRSCSEAGVEAHWCTCHAHKTVSVESPEVRLAANRIVNELNIKILDFGLESSGCALYNLRRILTARRTKDYYQITLEVLPEAVFEATVKVTSGSVPSSGIFRVDRYAGKSDCVHDRILRTLCYCKNIFTSLKSSIKMLL